jgi:DtxR family Mn-dependent transcriptional regulator
MPTQAVEDYLKAVFMLGAAGEVVTTSAVARRLGVAVPSASAMVKRLSQQGLLEHEPYGEVRLTGDGERRALRVVRRHRLVETFLNQVLGMPWDEVHDEAEQLEHVISERLEARIAALLGDPDRDPHGDPIPPIEGVHQERERHHPPLAGTAAGTRVRVERVAHQEPEALRYLADLGVVPGTELVVREEAPFGGPVWVETAGGRHALSPELAKEILVSVLEVAS